jgi:uncharacterized protein
MTNRISLVDLTVTDLDAAKAFYNSVFTLELKMEMPNYPLYSTGGADLGLILHGADEGTDADGINVVGRPTVNVAVDDIDAVLARVTAAGGKTLVLKTEIAPGIGHFAFFADPDGNILGLNQLS